MKHAKGPQGRHSIATSVRAWINSVHFIRAPQVRHKRRPALRASLQNPLVHGLTAVAIEWRPCGPDRRISLLFFAYCYLPTAYSFKLPPVAFYLLLSPSWPRSEPSPSPGASPQSSPSPSPSPSPTAVTGLHQWGAVTLFHGLPSIACMRFAQDADGVMWFGTEAGLAKFDGRRTQAVIDQDLPNGRVLALQLMVTVLFDRH